jgi:hypothetical protein
MSQLLLQVIIVVAFGAFCLGCGYLTAFIVTRNQRRDEMIKRGVAKKYQASMGEQTPKAIHGIAEPIACNRRVSCNRTCGRCSGSLLLCRHQSVRIDTLLVLRDCICTSLRELNLAGLLGDFSLVHLCSGGDSLSSVEIN